MKVAYLQKRGNTAVWIGSDPGMVGVARKRPGDRYKPVVGLAVALLKAEFGGLGGQDREVMEVEPAKDDIEKFELTDSQVLVWADMRHGMRLALRSVTEKRELHRQSWLNPSATPLVSPIPSDGQLCENFAIRFISDADLRIDK